MQTVDDFMRAFFSARVKEAEREMESRRPFRDKFFTPFCAWEARRGEKEQYDSETIESISLSGEDAEVITTWNFVIPRLRYHLQKSNNSWLIRCIEIQCPHCQGLRSHKLCDYCRGTGWLDPNEENGGATGRTGSSHDPFPSPRF